MRTPRGRALGSIRRGRLAFAAASLALLGAFAGCKSMTAAQAVRLAEERRREEEAKRFEEEAKAKAAEFARQAEELQKKEAELRRRDQIESWKAEAIGKLDEGDAEGALRAVRNIFEPPPLPVLDPETQKPLLDPSSGRPLVVQLEPPRLEKVDEARIRYLEGTILFQLRRKDEWIRALDRAIELDPEFRPARRDYGKMLFIEGEYRKALQVFQKELSDGYRDAELLFLVGQARYEVGREEFEKGNPDGQLAHLEAARIAFQGALVELLDKERELEIKRWLAILEFETGRYAEAVRLLEAIRREKPLDPQYLEYLANAYIGLEDYAKAIDYLELSARLRPSSPALAKSLGDLYAVRGLPGRAADWLALAYGGEPSKATASERLNVGFLYLDAARHEDAIRWLSAIARDPGGEHPKEYPQAQSALAYLYKDLGRVEEALAAFENVRTARPQDCEAHLAIAEIHLERKELDRAFDAYSRATGLADASCRADGFAGLAEVAYERGNLDEALRLYKKALEANPKERRFEIALREIAEEAKYRRGDASPGGIAASPAAGE